MAIDLTSPRGQVAANVNAELRRKNMNTKSLPARLGNSYAYWQRRTSADVAFSADDLFDIARILNVPVTTFFDGIRQVTHEYLLQNRIDPAFRQGVADLADQRETDFLPLAA